MCIANKFVFLMGDFNARPAIRLTLWTQMNFGRTVLVLMTAWMAVSIFHLILNRLIYPNIGYLKTK